MLDKFWESIGEGLGGKWIDVVVQPALFFWAAGLLAWVQHHQPHGWQALRDEWNGLGGPKTQLAVAALALLAILLSSQLMRWIERWLLRVLEGYHWPRFARQWAAERVCARLKPKKERWQALNAQVQAHDGDFYALRAAEREAYAQLDFDIIKNYPPTQTPPQPEDVMPTALGNRIKAAEMHSRASYGLESIFVWPRLWPLLSESLQQALGETRASLNTAVRLLGWGLLTCGWALWGAWWAVLAGLALAFIAWRRALHAAEVYGDLIRTAFDLHRFALYESLRWPPPTDTKSEAAYGAKLTQYLFRGTVDEPVTFAQKEKKT